MASTASELTDQQCEELHLLRVFVGPNADYFEKLYLKTGRNPEKKYKLTWNWAALLITFAWFFYRKMYLVGILFLALPIVAAIMIPQLPNSIGVMPAFFAATFANSFYLHHAVATVRQIRATAPPLDEQERTVAAMGGTSVVGLVVGLVILAVLTGLGMLAIMAEQGMVDLGVLNQYFAAGLPACDSEGVQELASQMAAGVAQRLELAPEQGTATFVEALSGDNTDESAFCAYSFLTGDDKFTVLFQVEWLDKADGKYQVRLAH
ncbi:MAG: DUF2628 domain-containing protein [Alphaproteobacteria bacterium]|nr:DUF2628 domain-containing protein [Alphaproteobacteria bacterium]